MPCSTAAARAAAAAAARSVAAFASRHRLNAEQTLEARLRENPCYPFTRVHNVYVFQYPHGRMWLGAMLLLLSIIGAAAYVAKYREVHREHAAAYLAAAGLLCVCVRLLLSGAPSRRLVLDRGAGEYCYSVHGRPRHTGPLNRVYIRMTAQRTRQMQQMYKLILKGHKIEGRDLSGFSEKYEFMELQGKKMATKLNLNYFDYVDVSARHVVIHRPQNPQSDNAMETVVTTL